MVNQKDDIEIIRFQIDKKYSMKLIIKYKRVKQFILIFLTSLAWMLNGQNIATQLLDDGQLSGGQLVSSSNIDLNVRKDLPANPLREEVRSAQLFVQLDLGEDYVSVLENGSFDVTINYVVELLDENDLTINSLPNESLAISNTLPERLKVIDFQSELLSLTNFKKIRIRILNPPAVSPLGDLPAKVVNFITAQQRLSAQSLITYGVDVRMESTVLLAPEIIVVPTNTNTLTNRVHEFSWSTNDYDFPNYEIQILKLTNSDPFRQNNDNEISARVDWSNALRVETQSSNAFIKLTIGEGTGFYIWRVRAIGNYFSGGIANHQNYGQWSAAPAQDEMVILNKNALSNPASFYFEDVNEDLNWIYNRVFTEGNQQADGTRVSEGISYADGLLNQRQNQVFNSANNSTLITQSILDYSGRNAMSTLPVPISGDLNSGYFVGFVQNNDNELYTAKHFDFNDDNINNIYAPNTVNETGTPFSYYSDQNSDAQIPSAEGYAFKRTLFKNDGTNRVSEESGVGPVHALGSQNDGQGRTTRILYAAPSEDELIRLFGEEAPLAEKVTKTITLDPNNVASVTYTTVADGNVIATALATIETPNLVALNNEHDGFNISNTATVNRYFNRQFLSSKRLAFASATEITLDYTLPCDDIGGWGGCNDGACEYSLSFILQDLTNGTAYIGNLSENITCGNVNLEGLEWKDPITNSIVSFPDDHIFTLPAGEYIFTKILADKLPVDFVSSSVDENNESEQVVIDAVAALMSEINNDEDFTAFENTINDLGNHFDIFNANPNDTEAANAILQILDLPSDFVLPEDFSLAYEENGNDPGGLSFTTACCGTSDIQVDKPDTCIPCLEIDGILNGTASEADVFDKVEEHFIPYLNDKLDATGIAFLDIAPGFTKESLQFMITQMLLSKYYTGNSRQASNNQWYKALHNDEGELVYAKTVDGELVINDDPEVPAELVSVNNGYNYTCKKLYDCWTQAVDMINAFEYENNINMMTEFNERQGDEESEDHYDDPDSKEEGGAFSFITDWIISEKMRKFSDSDEGQVSKERMESLSSVSNLFLACAGYQFAAIIDGETESLPIDYLDDYDKYKQDYVDGNNICNDCGLAETNIPIDVFNDIVLDLKPSEHGEAVAILLKENEDQDPPEAAKPLRLYYPYILKSHWMFKYYIYNVTDINNPIGYIEDTNEDRDIEDLEANHLEGHFLLPNHIDIEIQSCYNMPECSNDHELCFNPCRYDHRHWSSGQRLNFYKMIRNAPIDPEVKSIVDETTFQHENWECAENNSEYIPEALAIIEEVRSTLNARKGEFMSIISNHLNQNCWEIVDCTPVAWQVTEEQISQMAQGVINVAIEELDLIVVNVNNQENDYPRCESNPCYWIDLQGICSLKEKIEVTFFQPCDQIKLDQISYWEFLPEIPPKPGCTTTVDSGVTPANQAACDLEKDYSNTYSVDNSSLNN